MLFARALPAVTKFQILNEWINVFEIGIVTIDMLAFDAATATEWAALAAEHVRGEHGASASNFCLMGYSLGCSLSYDLYIALTIGRHCEDVVAMVVLDFPLQGPSMTPSVLDQAAIDAQVSLVLASAVMEEPWSLPHGERALLKQTLLANMPVLQPRFAAATYWMKIMHSAGKVFSGSVKCPVLIVCSSDPHPLFCDAVRPDLIEASWSCVCQLRPLVQVLSGTNHLSLVSDPSLGSSIAHFLCSMIGVTCTVDKLKIAARRSKERHDDIMAVQLILKRQWAARTTCSA